MPLRLLFDFELKKEDAGYDKNYFKRRQHQGI